MTTISAVTLVVPNLAETLRVYQAFGYPLLAEGSLSHNDVAVQHDSRLHHCAYATLGLNAGSTQSIELVEYPDCIRCAPFARPGWAAMELLVSDLDVVHQRVIDLDLTVWGEPQALSFTDHIKAMQVLGPAGELIYFTEQLAAVDAWPLPQVSSLFDQCFVAVLCSHQIDVSARFYATLLGRSVPAVIKSRVLGLSKLGRFSPDTLHPISAIPLGHGHWLELDQGPTTDVPSYGDILAGVFSVSIRGQHLGEGLKGLEAGIELGVTDACRLLVGPSGERMNWYPTLGV